MPPNIDPYLVTLVLSVKHSDVVVYDPPTAIGAGIRIGKPVM